MTCSPNDFKLAMRGLASGVSLVTTRDAQGQPHGMAATAVMSVSAEPPQIAICVNKTASMHGPVALAERFAVNFLAEDQADLVKLFSNPEARAQRFAGEGWEEIATGAPVHGDALSSLDCRVVQSIDAASHTMFIGEVMGSKCQEGAPLVFYSGKMGAFEPQA